VFVVEHGLNGVNHARDVGGQGCTQMQQTLINEELGKATGALWAIVWHPAVPLKHGTPEQIRDYLTPSCLGSRRACVAVTEPDVPTAAESGELPPPSTSKKFTPVNMLRSATTMKPPIPSGIMPPRRPELPRMSSMLPRSPVLQRIDASGA